MIKTLLFTDTSSTNIDGQINDFLQDNPIEVVDIKLVLHPIGGDTYRREALLIYKDNT